MAVSLAAILLLSALPGCRKKAAIQQPAPVPAKEARVAAEPRIRVLLDERFDSGRVLGARQAESLRFQIVGSHVFLLPEGSDDGGDALVDTGFRLMPKKDLLEYQGKLYRGYLDVFVNPYGVAVLVNDLPLEEYLQGVLPLELPPSTYDRFEALKAQAVAARTFALKERGRYADQGFDLFADQRSQVYGGASREHPVTNRAVAETRGVIVAFEGKPIVAMYCSTCGGLTESFSQVFRGGDFSYLRAGILCPDESSPYREWTAEVRAEEILSGLRSRGLDPGPLQRLTISRRTTAGRVAELRLVGEREEIRLEGNDLRTVLGLRSTWILSVEEERNEAGRLRRVRIRGRGWGHGVGLCQFGALELAHRGYEWKRILAHYYPGTEDVQWY
ncbi:MAG TPA: SpoIID/LytB domain-containing protein [Acidobacteriota bacterium]|nr:SpoIID/LytB domain-containing protein [Acidobacteriota bacterium]